MRTNTGLYCILLLAFVVTKATCLTNAEFYELVKDYATDIEIIEEPNEDSFSPDDVDDDVIELPGAPDDNLDIEYLMEQLGEKSDADDSATIVEDEQPPLKRSSFHCGRHYCKGCVSKTFKVRIWRHQLKFRLRACLKVAYRRRGFEITFTINGHRLLHKRYSLRRGLSLCYRVPQFPAAKICLDVYNINLRRKRACAKLTGKVKLGLKKFKVSIKIGCFQLPSSIMEEYYLKSIAKYPGYPYPGYHTDDLDSKADDTDFKPEMTYLDDALDDSDSFDDLDIENAYQNVQEMQFYDEDSLDVY